MERYRLIYATNPQEAEQRMNRAAAEGYRFVALSTERNVTDHLYVVMEHTGGEAGTVASEAVEAGIPAQSAPR